MPRRSRTIFDDLPLQRRVLAKGAIGLAKVLARTTRSKRGGRGTILVAYANLGDQLRMMNVLSRFLHSDEKIIVACNAGTEGVFSLYPCVAFISSFGSQGAASLRSTASRMLSTSALFVNALVPHPFMTAPIANAYALAHSATVHAMRDEMLVAESWKATYERFFEQALDRAPLHDKPQLCSEFRRLESSTERRIVVVHLATSAASRALDNDQMQAVVEALQRPNLHIVALGSQSEGETLRRIFSTGPSEVWSGKSLTDIARLLARADLFVGLDSSMMNLADAVGTRSVIIYPGTSPGVAGPFYTPSVAITPDDYAPVGVQALTSWSGAPKAPRIAPERIATAVRDELQRVLSS